MPSTVCQRCGHAETRRARFCPLCGQPLSGARSPRPRGAAGMRSRTSRVGFTLAVVFGLALVAWVAHSAVRQLDQLVYRPVPERHLQRRLYNQSASPEPHRHHAQPGRPR